MKHKSHGIIGRPSMEVRPQAMDTIKLSLELLRRIPRVRKITALELQQQLEEAGFSRSIRTIQRLLEQLSDQFEIERDDRSKPYGYRWKERSKGLSLPILSKQESLLLSLAYQQLHHLLPANILKSMEGLFAQADYNLGQGNKRPEKEWLKKVLIVSTRQPLLPPVIAENVFETVSNALFTNHWLVIDYTNAKNEQRERKVMPLGLAQQGERFYLVCRFDGYDNERSLALHRIKTARMSTLTFIPPPEFDLQNYDNEGRFGFGDGTRIKLTFTITHASGRHLLESKLAADQTVIELPEHYQISATVVDTTQLDWWLRGFGEAVSEVSKTSLGT